ncbi:MAG: apolipoprotein N-acyltransferase [Chitinophagaceae bacterium]|nr:apolipoprotein N-acyltransferase [Chitinophagaceae bacterium]MCW5904953.1 apolipoprotein N-acyltransferase [Chitinophagaceae bacterium]
MQKLTHIGLSILSGILLFIAWSPLPFAFCIFFAWIPLLFIADKVNNKNAFFGLAFLTLFIWNVCTTWWIWNSTDIGSIFAIAANSLLMYVPWWGYINIKKKSGHYIGYISLIAFWMLFEYIHLNWELSWPWLSIGNAFAEKTNWVQWYEYTGIGGGTLWVFVINILLYDIWKKIKQNTSITIQWTIKRITVLMLLIILPAAISISLLQHDVDNNNTQDNVVIVQPNIDPYQKFEQTSTSSQIKKLIDLSEKKIDENTKLVVWSETALSAQIALNDITTAPVYQAVFAFIHRHPHITLLTGVETYKTFTEPTQYTQKTTQGFYYESYNAAIALNSKAPMQLYFKSKLVPGVETLPSFLKILAPLFEKFGGTTGGYAKDTAATTFQIAESPFIAAPIICYESIYGAYVASYVQKGANLIAIITNDGWWGNTAGHKQHLAYAKLRAIETRRWVVRSANTGISAVINPYGQIIITEGWDKAGSLQYNLPAPNNNKTFYVRHGDYLYKIFSVLAVLILIWQVVAKINNRKNNISSQSL